MGMGRGTAKGGEDGPARTEESSMNAVVERDSWMELWERQQGWRHERGPGAPLLSDPLEGHRGQELFQTWALFRRGGNDTKSPVAKGGWIEPTATAHDGEPIWVVEIDHLIAYLARINEVYERLLKRRYLEELSVREVAEKVQRTEQFVLLSLRASCDLADRRIKP
jgi:hypothetical protein